jgi:hypothetical protein
MAQQPPNFQPILTESGFAADSKAYTNKLAGSSSSLGAVAGLAEAGIVGLSAYGKIKAEDDLLKTQQEIDAAVEPLIKEAEERSPYYQGEAAKSLVRYNQVLEQLPSVDGGDDPEELDNFVGGVQSAIEEKVTFLEKAKEQGRMDPFTFDMRLRDITKKFISDNPGLRPEILELVKNKLQDARIIDVLKYDESNEEKVAKAQEEELKEVRQELDKRNIPEHLAYVNGEFNLNVAKGLRDKGRANDLTLSEFERGSKVGKILSDADVEKFSKDGTVNHMISASFQKDSLELNQIFADFPNNFAGGKKAAIEYIARKKIEFMSTPGLSKYMANAEVKGSVELYMKQLDVLQESLQSFNSGADLKLAMENIAGTLDSASTIELLTKIPNLKGIELAVKMSQVPGVLASSDGAKVRADLAKLVSDVLTNTTIGSSNAFKITPGQPLSQAGLLLNGATEAAKDGNLEAQDNLSKAVEAIFKGLEDPKVLNNRDSQIKAYDEIINLVGLPQNVSSFIDISPQAASKYKEGLDNYTYQISASLDKYIATHLRDKEINIEINPKTGRLLVTGKDVDEKFNRDFTTRIDRALKAYANLRVDTPANVAKDFYTEYFSDVLLGNTAEKKAKSNNPGQLPDKEGKPQVFTTPKDGIEALESRILDIAGGTVGATKAEKIEVEEEAAQEFRRNKEELKKGKISKEEYGNRASSLNRTLKQKLYDLDAKYKQPKKVTLRYLIDGLNPAGSKTDMDSSNSELVDYIAEHMGVKKNEHLDLEDKGTLSKFMAAYSSSNGFEINSMRIGKDLKTKGDPLKAFPDFLDPQVKAARENKIKNMESQLELSNDPKYKAQLENKIKNMENQLELSDNPKFKDQLEAEIKKQKELLDNPKFRAQLEAEIKKQKALLKDGN